MRYEPIRVVNNDGIVVTINVSCIYNKCFPVYDIS
nr:MAG TPA: hypothetical protein [Caudoviricetes sp.]